MKKLSLFIIFTFLLFGCASTKVSHEGTISKKFAEVKATYGWFQSNSVNSDLRINSSTLNRLIQQSVDKQLNNKGYTRVEPDQADYLISWFGSITEEVKEISVRDSYSSYGYGSLAGKIYQESKDGKVIKTFSKGTLILDVLDPGSKMMLWRGSATNALKDNMTEAEVTKYLDRSVEKILKTLPRR